MQIASIKILEITDGGLDIFKHYIETPFEIDKVVKISDEKIKRDLRLNNGLESKINEFINI